MKINDLEDLSQGDWLRRLCWVVEQSKNHEIDRNFNCVNSFANNKLL